MQINLGKRCWYFGLGWWQWRWRKVNLFEGVNLIGSCDGLVMENEGKKRDKDDVVVLIYFLMSVSGIF